MKNKNYFILLVLFLSALQIKAQYSFDNVLYGAAYYHEYMPYERLDEDIRLMQKAKVNVVTVAVFAWANLEPEDGIYTFEWLDRVLDKLYQGGISVDLATATATPPRWLTSAHPEILPRNKQGAILWPGSRQQWRPPQKYFGDMRFGW